MTDWKKFIKWQDSFKLFCYECLGYKDMNNTHNELCDFMQNNQKRSRLVLMPRYSYKSCLCTVGYSLWKIINNRNVRILIYSDSATKAQGFLTDIKNHIEAKTGRSIFRESFGGIETDPHKGKWNESQIIISLRDAHEKEPTIDTGGIGTTKVGCHYDIIIFDDIVSDVNTTTKDLMDNTFECYQKSLSLLKPGGEVIIIGTRWDFGDLYGRIIAENEDSKEFEIFHRNAEDKTDTGKLLFEDIGLTQEFLDMQRRKQGSYLFSCLYNNSPVDPSTATFKVADFRFYGELEQSPHPLQTGLYKDLYNTCTVDPAGQGEDFTAISVVGTDASLKMYVLDLVNRKLQVNEIVDEVIRLNNKYHFKRVGIESTFYRGMLMKEINLRVQEEQKRLGFHTFAVEEFKTRWRKGEGKHQRILSLQPFHERGDLLFPGKSFERLTGDFSKLAYQMIQYPKAPHDDLIDALSWHVEIINRGGTPKRAGPPKNSAAWLEQQWINRFQERMSRYPARSRRIIQPAFT